MKLLKTTLYTALALLFISCGDNSETPLKDVTSIEINEASLTVFSTDTTSFTATVRYTDSTTADVTQEVNWISSDDNIATVSNGVVIPGNANGGDANITITYQQLTASPSLLTVTPLDSFTITNPDINVTGDYILEAEGNFGGVTQTIVKNIVWTADNAAIISVENDVSTITVVTGDTNVTATMFRETNSSSPIAPQTVTYTVD